MPAVVPLQRAKIKVGDRVSVRGYPARGVVCKRIGYALLVYFDDRNEPAMVKTSDIWFHRKAA